MRRPIKRAEWNKLVRYSKDCMRLASTHDPDLLKRIEVLERQMQRIGAPQYRLVSKGKAA